MVWSLALQSSPACVFKCLLMEVQGPSLDSSRAVQGAVTAYKEKEQPTNSNKILFVCEVH